MDDSGPATIVIERKADGKTVAMIDGKPAAVAQAFHQFFGAILEENGPARCLMCAIMEYEIPEIVRAINKHNFDHPSEDRTKVTN